MFEKQLNKIRVQNIMMVLTKKGKLTIKNQLRQNGGKATKLKSLSNLMVLDNQLNGNNCAT
jgi:hypothetical protein